MYMISLVRSQQPFGGKQFMAWERNTKDRPEKYYRRVKIQYLNLLLDLLFTGVYRDWPRISLGFWGAQRAQILLESTLSNVRQFFLELQFLLFFCKFLRSYMTSGQRYKVISSLFPFHPIPSMQRSSSPWFLVFCSVFPTVQFFGRVKM